MNEVTPITPDELLEYVRNHPNIPDFIIHTVNELIKKSWDGEKAIVHQDIIFEKLQIPDEWLKERGLAHKGLQEIKKYIYNNKLLDFEPYYRCRGWYVIYDKNGFNENYQPFYEFRINETDNES